MNVAPTLEGGLRIDARGPTDWIILEMICIDALSDLDMELADRLSQRMTLDADWTEFIRPDLISHFSAQITHVHEAVSEAERDEELAGQIFISTEGAEQWFGALNQARIALETNHSLSKLEDEFDDVDDIEEPTRSALLRSHFYSTLQGMLLEYVMQ